MTRLERTTPIITFASRSTPMRNSERVGIRMGIALGAVTALFTPKATAQGAPGTRLTVDVSVVQVTWTGGVTQVSYRVSNRRSSQEQVLMFVVDAPAPVVEVVLPSPESDWTT